MALQEGADAGGSKPKVYYFRGKAYYTQKAYNRAVASYNAAQAAKRAAASAAAVKTGKRTSPAPSRPKAPVVDPAISPAVRRAAAERARQIQAQLKADAAKRAAIIAQQRVLQLKKAEAAALLSAQARERSVSQERRQQREMVERMMADQRRRAYEAIQRQAAEIRRSANAQRLQRMMGRELDEHQVAETTRLRAGLTPETQSMIGGFTEGVEDTRGVRVTGPGAVIIRRNRVLKRARQTGDWQSAVDLLEEQSAQTGGRFVDEDLLKVVQEELILPVQQVGEDFALESRALSSALNEDNIEKALEIWQSPRYQRLQQEYLKWYGDPFAGSEGAFASIYEKLSAISERRERIRLRLALGAPPGSTDEDLMALIEKQKEKELADMTSSERGYHILPDGTQVPYKGRRDGDYAVHWSDYYNRKSDQFTRDQKIAIEKAQRYQRFIAADLKAQGFKNIRFEEGMLLYDDPNEIQWVTQMQNLLPDFETRAKSLQQQQFKDPYAFQQSLKTFMSDAEAAWEDRYPRPAYTQPVNYGTRSKTAEAVPLTPYQVWERQKRAFMDQTYGAFTGEKYGILQTAAGTPLAAPLEAALFFWNSITSSVRWFGQQGLGQKYQPYLNVHVVGKGGGDVVQKGDEVFGGDGITGDWIEFGRVYDENADEAWAMVKDAMDSGDLGRVGFALNEYSQWGKGNVGWLLTQLVDPTQFMGISELVRPTRIAVARLGGWRAVAGSGPGGLSDLLRNIRELSGPTGDLGRRLRGSKELFVGRRREIEWSRIRMAQALEISYKEVMDQSDEFWDDLVQQFTKKQADRALTQEMGSFLNKSKLNRINPDLVMVRAEAMIPKIAKQYKLMAADPARIAKQMAGVEAALREATAAAEEARSVLARRQSLSESAAALKTLRSRFPKQLTKRPVRILARDQIKQHEVLVREYVGSAEAFLETATRAKGIVDQIQELGRKAKRATAVDDKAMARLQRDLRRAIGEMSAMRDKVQLLPGSADDPLGLVRRRRIEGRVSQNWRRLQDYRATIGGDPNAPSFTGIKNEQIASDFQYLSSRIRGLTSAIRRETDPTELARLRGERDLARQAFAGLRFEREARSARALARQAIKEMPGRVDQAVARRQLGGLATTVAERVQETARSISGRLGHAQIEELPALPDVQREILDRVIPRLDSIDATSALKAAGLEEYGSVTLREAIMTFEKFRAVGGARAVEFEPIWKNLMGRLKSELKSAGWRPMEGMQRSEDVLGHLRYEHIRNGAKPIDLAGLEQLDERVAAALREARGRKAEGLVRRAKGPPKEFARTTSALLFYSDADPRDILTKIRALEGTGVDLYQYDMLRSAMGDIMRKKWAMDSIRAEALVVAGRTGRDIEEVYSEIWSNRARAESRREFEEFALRDEFQGMTPRQLVAAFEEEYMGRHLASNQQTMTQYQYDSLAASYQAQAKHPWANEATRAQFFSGRVHDAPGTVTLTGDALPGRLAQDVPDAIVRHVTDDEQMLRLIDEASEALPAREIRDNPFKAPEMANLDEIRRLEAKFDAAAAAEASTQTWKRTKPISGLVKYARSVSTDPLLRRRKFRERLWARMKADKEFRDLVKDVGGRSDMPFAGEFAEDVRRARDYLRSNEGLAKFREPRSKKMTYKGGATWNGDKIRYLKERQAMLHHVIQGSRDMAGIHSLVEVDDAYIRQLKQAASEVSDEVNERLDEMLEDFVSGGTRRAANLKKNEFLTEAKKYRLPVGDLDYIIGQLRQAAEEVQVKQGALSELAERLPSGSELVSQNPLLRSDSVPVGADAHRWYRRMLKAQAALKEVNEELGYTHGLKRDATGKLRGVFVWFEGDEAGEVGRVLAPGVYVFGEIDVETIAHEIMHAMWRMPENEALVKEMVARASRLGHDTALLKKVSVSGAAGPLGDKQEFLSELYGIWYSKNERWEALYRGFDSVGRMDMDYLASHFENLRLPTRDSFGYASVSTPPFGNRSRISAWLVDNGYWPKRLGEQISRGERTWSITDERRFFESNWGYTPEWTKPEVLKPLLNNQHAMEIAFRSWGMMDDGFERLSSGVELNAHQLQASVAWGAEGFQRKRTLSEIRRYAIERYGDLVTQDGKTLDRMPWLMAADDEYLRWTRWAMDEASTPRIRAEWEGAFKGLPEPIQRALFDGDSVKADGLDLMRGNLKPHELDALKEAIVKATDKRLNRMRSLKGDPDPRHFLPQEQVRFAFEVTNELLADQRWRHIVKGDLAQTLKNLIGQAPATAVGLWGQLFRTLVSWQPAFAVMNLIDSYGFKRVYLQIAENGFRPLGWDRQGRTLIRNLTEAGLESRGVFGLATGASSFGDIVTRVGDRDLSWNVRGGAAVSSITHLPILISKAGEDRLRLQFAQSVAGKAYRGALKQGMSVEAAEHFARAEARRVGEIFFAQSGKNAVFDAIDQLVPFFNYQFKNSTLGLRIVMDHPQVYAWVNRVTERIKDANRERWEREFPGVPFPENDPSSGWMWVEIDGRIYKIDLSSWSDWTRALRSFTNSENAIDFASNFIRIPHPSQLGALAILTGGITPWGKDGDISKGGLRELSIWADLLYWMNGRDYTKWDDQRDAVQMLSQLLFFKKWGTVLPVKVKQITYFAMQDAGDYEGARAYLEANPDLLAYWASKGKKAPDPFADRKVNRWELLTQEEKSLYSASYQEFEVLMAALDLNLAKYAKEPWSDEYKAAKKEAYNMRTSFLARHPELTDFWVMFQSPAEFAKMKMNFKLDDEIEAFFSMKRPVRGDYKSELAFQRAMVEYYDLREKALDVSPALRDALYGGRTQIERAYHDTELMWSEILEAQARLKVKILEEEARGASADREMISTYYDIRSDLGLALDNERYGMFLLDARGNRLPLEERLAQIPGFGALIRAGQTPEQRDKSDANLRYARGISAVMERATDGKTFYDLLRKDPWLLREYWRRNPDAKARFEAGAEYVRLIGGWAEALKRDDFVAAQRIWDSLPAWVKERYFEAHPNSGMRDGMGGGGSATAVQYNGQWFKSPESRDRYIYFIEQGGQGPVPKGLDVSRRPFSGEFSSPEARMRFIRGQEYYATIGGWVELLKAKEYDKADKYFRSMPQWMQDKYFDKHPDQRARFELDSGMLRAGAEYFLASGDDKLKILHKYPALARWLKEHGGEEAEFRGLINAIYRAIPSKEAWLKRTFRERYPEIFSQEAAGERRLAGVAADLARNPEVLPFYEKAVKLQYHLWLEQLKRNETPPKPWTLERKRRLKERRRRRGARLHSLWSLHRDTRRGANTNIDRLPRP